MVAVRSIDMSPRAQAPAGLLVGQPLPGTSATLPAARQTIDAPMSADLQAAVPLRNVVRLPEQTPLDYTFDVRQQWEGVVSSIGEDEFSVVLRDLTHPDASEHEAVLPTEEIPEDDLPLLQVGAVLYWTIGYRKSRTGQRDRVSTIRLRRLPAWTRAEIARVQREARALDDLFKSE
jgi:hypothetical protein